MTEKECLEKMLLVWDYLYHEPDKTKEEVYRDLNLSLDLGNCPCCEYVSQIETYDPNDPEEDIDCNLCPLYDLWPDICYIEGTPFNDWYYAETNTQRRAACQKILIATKERLETLEGAYND